MTEQEPAELKIEEINPEDEKLIHPEVFVQNRMPVIIPVAGISVIVIVMAITALVISGMLQKKKGNVANAPTPTREMKPSIIPSSPPSATSSGIKLVNLPPTSLPLILEVSAVGGGAMGEKHEYTINAPLEKEDKLYVMQRSEEEITGFPGYVKGALDTGLRIEHKNTYLDIKPVFEGAGMPLLTKPSVTVIENRGLTDGKIYRIKYSDIKTSTAESSSSLIPGFFYTTQYIENKKECSSTFEPESGREFPACFAGSSDVMLKNGTFVSISCHGTEPDPKWCDSLMDEITIHSE